MIDLDKKCAMHKCCICVYEEPCCDNKFNWLPDGSFKLACPKEIKIRLNNDRYTPNQRALMLDILKQYRLGEIVENEKGKNMETKTYEQGLEEAWKIARDIVGYSKKSDTYYSLDLDRIFGDNRRTRGYLLEDNPSIHEVKAKIDAWEAEKNKPKLGDVVVIDDIGEFLFLGESEYCYHVLDPNDDGVPRMFDKSYVCKIKKTGKHFDIQGMLDEIDGEYRV